MAKVQWQLRYRSPLAPSKGVDDVIIATNSDDAAIARQVADDWLNTERAHPSTRFIYLRPNEVHSEDAMRARQAPQTDAPAEPVKPTSEAERPVTATVLPTSDAVAAVVGKGEANEDPHSPDANADDQMSGPRSATPVKPRAARVGQ